MDDSKLYLAGETYLYQAEPNSIEGKPGSTILHSISTQ
jgi:hypothetical protein